MKVVSFLRAKLNNYSIVGSLLYGFLCVLASAPEVYGGIIGSAFCFLSAALFYFAMYVFFSQHREMMSRLWKNKFKYIGILILCLVIVSNGACLMYMYVYKVSLEVAIEKITLAAWSFGCHIPFLP